MLRYNTLFGEIDKVAEAIKILKRYEPPEGYYVAFSGGKDSLVIYWLTKIACVKADYHYHFTGVDPPELVKFVRGFDDVQIDLPRWTMWQLLRKKTMPPTSQFRYCCGYLKEYGGRGRVKIVGVRREESAKRKDRQVVQLDRATINPIYHWSEADVWEFLNCNIMDYCQLYDEGYNRLGCVGCPLASLKQREKDFERYPLYKKAYIRSFDEMCKNSAVRKWSNGEEVFEWWMKRPPRKNDDQLEFNFEI